MTLRKDLLAEGALARAIEFPPHAEELSLASSFVYAQVLHALWDSGFYEYVRAHPRFRADAVCAALGLDPFTLHWLLYYLAGRGLLQPAGGYPTGPAGDDSEGLRGELELTPLGARVHNTIARGLLNLYVGGYQGLLGQLGPLLRREVRIDDPRLDRSARHAAAGTEDVTCVRVVPQVIDLLREEGVSTVLDLGCGTGGFLIQWALVGGPAVRGAGVDMSAPALAAARDNADAWHVGERLGFHLGEVGKGPLPIGEEVVAGVQAVTAMFMLHEFGRDGDAGVVRVLSSLGAQFPGRKLVALEMQPVDVLALRGRPPVAIDQLDYHFIHPLSRQGEPRGKPDWERLYAEAGMKLVRVRRPANSPLLIHLVQM